MWSGHSSCPLEVCDVGGWRSWDPSEALSCGCCYVCVGRTVGFVLPWGREGGRGGRSEKLSEKTEVGKAHCKQKAQSVQWHSGAELLSPCGMVWLEHRKHGRKRRDELEGQEGLAISAPDETIPTDTRSSRASYVVHQCLVSLSQLSFSPAQPCLLPHLFPVILSNHLAHLEVSPWHLLQPETWRWGWLGF